MAQQLSATGADREASVKAHWPSGFARSQLFGAGATLAILLGWTLLAAFDDSYGHPSPLFHYSFAMGWTGVAVAFPFLVLVPVVLTFSQQLNRRWVFYARTRTPLQRYLTRIVWTNAWMNFAVFFLYCFVSFVVFYYIAPRMGMTYDSDLIGSTDATFARLTHLVDVHPLIYALTYSAWQGLNAVLWASVGLAAVLLIRQRILAFTVPFALFALLSILMGVAGPPWAWNTPWLMWILFSVSAVPFLPSVLILGAMYAVVGVILWLVIRRSDRLGVLQ